MNSGLIVEYGVTKEANMTSNQRKVSRIIHGRIRGQRAALSASMSAGLSGGHVLEIQRRISDLQRELRAAKKERDDEKQA